VSSSLDKTLKVWDLNTGKCFSTLKGHQSSLNAIAVTPDGKRAVSGSSDKTLKVWNLDTGECLTTLIGHADAVRCVAVTLVGSGCIFN